MLNKLSLAPDSMLLQKQANAAPRFGATIPVLPQKTMADTFFMLPSKIDDYFAKSALNSTMLGRAIAGPLKVFTKAFSNHDYSGMFSLGKLGRVGVIPPLGAIATIVIPVTLLGRLYCSSKRSSLLDSREVGDILRRDIPTLAILVFMLDPLLQSMTNVMQKRQGLQLMTHLKDAKNSSGLLDSMLRGFTTSAHPLSYTQLDRYYTLNSPSRLAHILSDKFNHPGVTTALRRFGKAGLNPEQQKLLEQFSTTLQNAMTQASKTSLKSDTPVIQKLFQQMSQFDTLAVSAGKSLKIRSFIADYAKIARHISAFTGLAIIVGLLGFGVTKFNEWWAISQYNRMIRKESDHYMKGHPRQIAGA